ncbi:PadR family transcriptional regulator [Bacillus carboniphilus]|uniref:PadR family transcriptional regulator n=1 Tax=Bacillus carboniphilus TaxID=86663 RepID=A0ABY9JVY3_9BACI|nr:PadR family transcriptional regulator [Bacillus carboniphilus]WLR41795.1 PadR family transcriptional regulator [Bacillus carboniphilus]
MTRLMVLGLLMAKPMTGYDIQQIMQQSQTDRWANILPGSIYHALKKMEKEALVEIDSIQQQGNRTKAIYQITDKGKEEFQQLLKESLQVQSVHLPTDLYTGLSFVSFLPKDEVVKSLSVHQKELQEQLEIHRQGKEIKEQVMEIDKVTELTFDNIFKQYELQLQFVQSLLDYYQQ